MKTQISIMGCGWLGLSLAQKLVKEGYIVNGSTTTKSKLQEFQKQRINPFLITLTETSISGDYSKFLTGSDTVIINIPPGLRKDSTKNHVEEIKHLIPEIEKHKIKNILYISSTSVFEDAVNFPVITAKKIPNATSNNGKQLIAIEQMLQANSNFKTTILRFGGLIDETRHPSKFLSGKTNISNPEAPINLIHKTDCIAIISSILKNGFWNITLNAAYPKHPNKESYYKEHCERNNLPLPIFSTSGESKGKIIDSKIMVQLLNYTFKEAP
ncbi:NAD(P)H-binding protein [Winogradskyella helgolandensis]|uniref:NAD(P)H-binding protein n=1 Tax=Winogradskyella helgolandensis TaxID=2697010 RepID=UPI0015C02287|nr:NAD(P)H-binding protein [Winogradskyella helgolandensis]